MTDLNTRVIDVEVLSSNLRDEDGDAAEEEPVRVSATRVVALLERLTTSAAAPCTPAAAEEQTHHGHDDDKHQPH